jgi:hypothetical protein
MLPCRDITLGRRSIMTSGKHLIKYILVVLLALVGGAVVTTGAPTGVAARGTSGPQRTDIVSILDKTGYNYTKIENNIWEIEFKGKNFKEFPVRIIQADDLTILMCKIADRKDLIQKEALYQKLLELNDSMDTIKFAISKDMLYGRIEMHTRLLNEKELAYLLSQMSGAIDEAYPQIKQYLGGDK